MINDVHYSTPDKSERGMIDPPQRGHGMTMNALRNSVKARNRVGLR